MPIAISTTVSDWLTIIAQAGIGVARRRLRIPSSRCWTTEQTSIASVVRVSEKTITLGHEELAVVDLHPADGRFRRRGRRPPAGQQDQRDDQREHPRPFVAQEGAQLEAGDVA